MLTAGINEKTGGATDRDDPAGPAHTEQLLCDEIGTRRKHGPEQARHHVEAGVDAESLDVGQYGSFTTMVQDDDADQVIVKSTGEIFIIGTSETHTTDTSLPNDGSSDVPVAVGEVVTFQLVVSIPEGTSDDVLMTDVLVPGLDFVTGSGRVCPRIAPARCSRHPGGDGAGFGAETASPVPG